MKKLLGVVSAGLTALVIGFAPIPSATAAPALTGTGSLIRDTVPEATEEVRWRGGGGRGFHGHRGFGRGHWGHRRWGYRHFGYRPVFARPAYYGGGCFWRPARTVSTPYGWQFRPARRICRW